jgi:hypothetical protein
MIVVVALGGFAVAAVAGAVLRRSRRGGGAELALLPESAGSR